MFECIHLVLNNMGSAKEVIQSRRSRSRYASLAIDGCHKLDICEIVSTFPGMSRGRTRLVYQIIYMLIHSHNLSNIGLLYSGMIYILGTLKIIGCNLKKDVLFHNPFFSSFLK